MRYTFAITVVSNPVKNNMLLLAEAIDFEAGGMWTRPMSITGALPATRWISNGMTPNKLLEGMADPVKMFNFARAKYLADGQDFPFTQLQVTNALGNCTVTDGTFNGQPEDAFALAARLGLLFINTPLP